VINWRKFNESLVRRKVLFDFVIIDNRDIELEEIEEIDNDKEARKLYIQIHLSNFLAI
jgi:hypothetical protein